MKYKKLPIVVEAYQTDKEMDIQTLEGTMHASIGDYIITGINGEQYPCKPDIFVKTYEKAEPERSQWISVKERLPEPRFAREWYLVALESGCVKTLAYEKPMVKGALFHKGWHETASPVTHWMPLPEPPKEGEHDEH